MSNEEQIKHIIEIFRKKMKKINFISKLKDNIIYKKEGVENVKTFENSVSRIKETFATDSKDIRIHYKN